MIEEQAVVVALRGDQALVQTERRSTCSGCSARSGCGAGLLSRLVGRRFAELAVANDLDLQIGDRVMLGLSESGLVKGAMAIYGLPLVGMFTGALLAQSVLATGSEPAAIAGAAGGLLVGLLLARLYIVKSASAVSLQPRVLRRVRAPQVARVGLLAP